MPELRKDPITGRWVIIAVERARKPKAERKTLFESLPTSCPFCEGSEAQTREEIFSIRKGGSASNEPGWQVRVVPSKAPFLSIEPKLERHGRGLYDVMSGVGAHEVIIETPSHVTNIADLDDKQVAKVITTAIERFVDLSHDERFKYVLFFKNYGVAGTGPLKHTRSQLIATPVTPKRVKEELNGSRKYFEYRDRCIYCDLIREEQRLKERIVLETDHFLVVTAFASRFPFETWILPKKHHCDFSQMGIENRLHLAKVLRRMLRKLKIGLGDPAYNFMLHTSPFRRPKAGYWKTIEQDYHWHIEIIPRLVRPAGFEWGTGFYICCISPEEGAKYLRQVKDE